MGAQGRYEVLGVEALRKDFIQHQQGAGVIPGKEIVHKLETVLVIQDIEVAHYIPIPYRCAAEGYGLVENGKGVAHSSISFPGNDMQRLIIYVYALLGGDGTQIAHYVRDADAAEVISLAAAQNGREYLVLLGRGKDEDGVCRRLLKGLEKSIEGLRGEHMHLIYDENGILPGLRRNLHQVHQGLDILHAIV